MTREELIAAGAGTVPDRIVGEKLGLKQCWVSTLRRRFGIAATFSHKAHRKRGTPLTTVLAQRARAESMVALLKSGSTLESVGEQFGVTRERVRQIVKPIVGATKPLQLERTRKKYAMLKTKGEALVSEGHTRADAARELGVNVATLAAAGVESQNSGGIMTKRSQPQRESEPRRSL